MALRMAVAAAGRGRSRAGGRGRGRASGRGRGGGRGRGRGETGRHGRRRGSDGAGASRSKHQQQQCCPFCGAAVVERALKRHLALCAPETLDPEGWQAGGKKAVAASVAERHPSPRAWPRRVLSFRFGLAREGDEALPPSEVARLMSADVEAVTATIRAEVKAVPFVRDADEPLEVLLSDDWLMAVNKRPGVPCTPRSRLAGGSVANAAAARLGTEPHVLHRLDLSTSGVLLLGKNRASATSVMQQFERREVEKLYLALCRRAGDPEGEADGREAFSVRAPIARMPVGGRCVRTTDTAEVSTEAPPKPARTDFTVVACSDAATLLLARPRTGRTHQVRLHCAYAGAAILGDDLYDAEYTAEPALYPRHMLHAAGVGFTHPGSARRVVVHAPLPEDMRKACKRLGIDPAQADGAVKAALAKR